MKKTTCERCGKALTRGARFCTSCGAITGAADTANAYAPETRPFHTEGTDHIVSSPAAITETFPAQPAPADYSTEETPQIRITVAAPSSDRLTEDIATKHQDTPVAKHQDAPAIEHQIEKIEAASAGLALANQSSSRRRGLLLAGALGVVALAAGSFFIFNSRKPSETHAANQPAGASGASASPRPSIAPSVELSSSQSQPQPASTLDAAKSAAAQNAETASKAQQNAAAKSSTATPQEKKSADGGVSNLNQGIAHLSARRYQDALREFEVVKKQDPRNTNVYYLIGQAYQKMGQLENALEAYRRCTSGDYASIAQNHVKMLSRKLGKTY